MSSNTACVEMTSSRGEGEAVWTLCRLQHRPLNVHGCSANTLKTEAEGGSVKCELQSRVDGIKHFLIGILAQVRKRWEVT